MPSFIEPRERPLHCSSELYILNPFLDTGLRTILQASCGTQDRPRKLCSKLIQRTVRASSMVARMSSGTFVKSNAGRRVEIEDYRSSRQLLYVLCLSMLLGLERLDKQFSTSRQLVCILCARRPDLVNQKLEVRPVDLSTQTRSCLCICYMHSQHLGDVGANLKHTDVRKNE